MTLSLYFALVNPLTNPFSVNIPERGISIKEILYKVEHITFGYFKILICKEKSELLKTDEAADQTLWKVEGLSLEGKKLLSNEVIHGSSHVTTNSIIIMQPSPPTATGKCLQVSQNKRARKLVKTEGPVDVLRNFYVSFNVLESTCKPEEAINEHVCVFLVGHFQSGKSSTLHYFNGIKENYIYIHSSKLAIGFLYGLYDCLSLDLCNNINDFDYKIGAEGIKLIVFAGSFSISTMIEDRNLQIKSVIEMSSHELLQKSSQEFSLKEKQIHSCLQKPVEVPSPLNSSKSLRRQILTKGNTHTNGYAGLEGLFASLCIEYASDEKSLDFKFIRNPIKKISGVKHIEKYLTDNNDNTFVKDARHLLERFLQRGTLSSSEIVDNNLIAIVHLRAIGIIKCKDNYFEFTSNIILDLLSSIYYPVYDRKAFARIPVINSPLDFLKKVLDLLKYINHDVIFDPLATNQHSFSEPVIQGELYSSLCTAVSYPAFKVFRETRTLKKSKKKCNIWMCNNKEYGIECKVNKISDYDIISAADQAIGYKEGRENVCCMLVLNFVPCDSKPHDYNSLFQALIN
ncbi:12522_t:CDS:2 [Funneliformis geosporum]|uniref:12522_t:CDS:1 n=1 Tax=Funneliformis geosporum TaxID=1117311 RepID=A0A9W4T270_9GLOM|nr:12522_t:CDS:2 [Funneliformis geosporum]